MNNGKIFSQIFSHFFTVICGFCTIFGFTIPSIVEKVWGNKSNQWQQAEITASLILIVCVLVLCLLIWYRLNKSKEIRVKNQENNKIIGWDSLPLIFCGLVTIAVIFIRSVGIIQGLELYAYDGMLKWRGQEKIDPRILVVRITDKDIEKVTTQEKRNLISDQQLNSLLKKLEQKDFKPRTIGLDIYREAPTDKLPELKKRLETTKNLYGVCKGSDKTSDETSKEKLVGRGKPPELPPVQVGLSDVVEDNTNGLIRRHLIAIIPEPNSNCKADYTFSAKVAFDYLEGKKIKTKYTNPTQDLQTGKTIFTKLKSGSGGYQQIEDSGYQIMLNYRLVSASPRNIVQDITLQEILDDKNPNLSKFTKDKIVLIGTDSTSYADDYWVTPYFKNFLWGEKIKIPGVFLQAQKVSQIISAVLEKRPLINSLPWLNEILFIGFWSLGGAFLPWIFRTRLSKVIGTIYALGFLGYSSMLFLKAGIWVPFIPSVLAFLASFLWVILRFKFDGTPPLKTQQQEVIQPDATE